MKNSQIIFVSIIILIFSYGWVIKDNSCASSATSNSIPDIIEVTPSYYNKALRNPLKGFTTRGIYNHEWATLAHTYIRWNEIENHESDGIEKIRRVTDNMWGDIASRNVKVIPRVYLHWSGERKFWPSDMQPDDYTSEQFQYRVVRLIERLGFLWDTDPRVAFIELGIFGKWGEQEQPFATEEIEKLVADAVAKAFKNKLVSVRRNWEIFNSQPFGEYWDSWAHYDQMWPHGNNIAILNSKVGRYLKNYVGGEVAYDWGNGDIQPGPSPTASVSEETHRNFIINSIRWLHCTQLRWIDDYDSSDEAARMGAEIIQKAFGYRFIIEKVRFNPTVSIGELNVEIHVKNEGSAPFYYDWPLELSLLDPKDRSIVWKQYFEGADIRQWHPGQGWTPPDWITTDESDNKKPNKNWTDALPEWTIPPETNAISGKFNLNLPVGEYILALAILDPAGNVPSVRFATSQYFKGGHHPIGMVTVGKEGTGRLPDNIIFDNPHDDNTLYYLP